MSAGEDDEFEALMYSISSTSSSSRRGESIVSDLPFSNHSYMMKFYELSTFFFQGSDQKTI
jgi:hypothetical protein